MENIHVETSNISFDGEMDELVKYEITLSGNYTQEIENLY